MSVFKLLFTDYSLDDHRQDQELESARFEASASADMAAHAAQQLLEERRRRLELQRRVDRLELLAEALVRSLESSGQLRMEQLKAVLRGLDLTDGKVDGRMSDEVMPRVDDEG